jgi:peptidoglycan/LPS O-acetylase OafA/YrhL
LVFVDVLRDAVIAWVVVHHAALAYGPTSLSWPVHDPAHSDWFGPLLAEDAAIGLGLLFLLAGYFVPGSCERKGAGCFLRHCWARIGVPLVLFVLAVNLPIEYATGSFRSVDEFVMAAGGLNISSLARSAWEAVICTGLCIGLIVLLRELVRGGGRLLAALAETSYAAYILHLYLVITLQFEVTRLELPAVAKFAIVAVLGIVLAYGLALLSRAIPGVRVILCTAPAAGTTTRPRSRKPRHQTDPVALQTLWRWS